MHWLSKKNIIGTREVCEILGINKSHVHRDIIRKGKIPARRISCGWIFLEEDVLKYQKQRASKAKNDRRINLKD